MTFEEREKEIFFDTFHTLSGGDLTAWLSRNAIIAHAGTKITVQKAEDIFNDFYAPGYLYVESGGDDKYRISDSGKIYYEFLKKESTKYELDRKSVEATIQTAALTRRNIRIGWILGVVTFFTVAANLFITIRKDTRERQQQIERTKKETEMQSDIIEENKQLQQINKYLKDTARIKVKIVK